MKKLFQQEITKKEDILLVAKPDRRLLSKVPDKEELRTNVDRRQVKGNKALKDISHLIENETMGRRYLVDYDVSIQYVCSDKKVKYLGKGADISTTGMLLEVSPEVAEDLRQASKIKLKFFVAPGTMPEGYEMKVDIAAKYIRFGKNAGGKTICGVEFLESLAQYRANKKNLYMASIAAFFLFVIIACILLMRAESILYFKFNKVLYMYSIIATTFLLTRYLFASFYRPIPIDKGFTPGITIVIPCFNEE